MAGSLQLRVLTPRREVVDETVEAVTAEGALGQFGVLPEHITYLTALEPGPLTWKRRGGGGDTLAVKGGYAEVRDDVMTVLAEEALPVDGIDPAEARAEVERAKRALEEAPYGHPDHDRLRRDLRWAELLVSLSSR